MIRRSGGFGRAPAFDRIWAAPAEVGEGGVGSCAIAGLSQRVDAAAAVASAGRLLARALPRFACAGLPLRPLTRDHGQTMSYIRIT